VDSIKPDGGDSIQLQISKRRQENGSFEGKGGGDWAAEKKGSSGGRFGTWEEGEQGGIQTFLTGDPTTVQGDG